MTASPASKCEVYSCSGSCNAPCRELADVCAAVGAGLQLSKRPVAADTSPVVFSATSAAFPFIAGLETDDIGALALPFQSGAAALCMHIRAVRQAAQGSSGSGACSVWTWPAPAYRFANPAWDAHMRQLVGHVRDGLQLPRVRVSAPSATLAPVAHPCVMLQVGHRASLAQGTHCHSCKFVW